MKIINKSNFLTALILGAISVISSHCVADPQTPLKSSSTSAKPPLMGPAIGRDKKLIKWGQDATISSYVRKNVREMEKWDFDGICIEPDLRKGSLSAPMGGGHLFSTRRFTYEELRHIVDDLRATKFTRFTDNFLVMGAAVQPLVYMNQDWTPNPQAPPPEIVNSPDWFNDAEFSILVNNWALAARVCREAGLKGFMVDVELWGSIWGKCPRPWNYRFLRAHNNGDFPSYEACVKQWYERGKQLMAAICKEYPDIVFLNYQGSQQFAYDAINWAPDPDPNLPPLANSEYGLSAPFFDGILAGIPAKSKATVIDGGPMYHATLDRRFKDYRNVTFKRSLEHSTEPAAFKKHMRLAFATWVDGRGYLPFAWSQEKPYYSNQFTPDELEHSLYNALRNSDKYCWIWSEKAIFFPRSGRAQQLTGMKATVNDDYRRAIANAKKPHRLDYQRDDRGALAEPLPPKASEQPGYSDAETFAPLDNRFSFVADLPREWWFHADREGLGNYPMPFSIVNFDLNGWNWKDWDKIEIGDYIQNRGYRFKGNAWYRVDLDIPANLAGSPLYLAFGGITKDPNFGVGVFVNGSRPKPVEDLPADFKGAVYDITEQIKPGQKNVLSVCLYNYSGPGGIYKTVKLATSKPTP